MSRDTGHIRSGRVLVQKASEELTVALFPTTPVERRFPRSRFLLLAASTVGDVIGGECSGGDVSPETSDDWMARSVC